VATIEFDQVTKRFDDGTVAVDNLNLGVGEGEFLILVGPSGCGKTTALRMAAGLEEVTSGEIRIGDQVVNDVRPSQRDVAMVFQNYALYPHMTAFENISFPLRQQRLPRNEIDARVKEAARFLSIEELLGRKPKELSGGQRQRVAMGRAIVRKPRAFLMDEPLSNLDAKLRVQMRAELISLHQRLGVTTVYVTHDQTEAMTLGDRVAVLNKGVVQQVDAPETLYRRPANTFVAGFIGSPSMNFLHGEIVDGGVRLGSYSVELPDDVRGRPDAPAGKVLVGVRPEDFAMADDDPGLRAEIQITEQLGPEMLAHFRVEGVAVAHPVLGSADDADEAPELSETLVARLDPSAGVLPGQRVRVRIDGNRIQLFDPGSGRSLHQVSATGR
jgi:multiple sugar transport system ATP-binding protein